MSAAQSYEYKTVKYNRGSRRDLEKVLNKHARDGWELDHIDKKSVLAFGSHDTAVLRRTAT